MTENVFGGGDFAFVKSPMRGYVLLRRPKENWEWLFLKALWIG
jgi:hypothetical protein